MRTFLLSIFFCARSEDVCNSQSDEASMLQTIRRTKLIKRSAQKDTEAPEGWILIKENWNCQGSIERYTDVNTLEGCAEVCSAGGYPVAGLWDDDTVGCRCYENCDGGQDTTTYTNAVIEWATDDLEYHLDLEGSDHCSTESASILNCLQAVVDLLPEGETQGRTTLVSGSWSHVPKGCSAQSGGDWAAHYNSLTTGHNSGIYSLVCTEDASLGDRHDALAEEVQTGHDALADRVEALESQVETLEDNADKVEALENQVETLEDTVAFHNLKPWETVRLCPDSGLLERDLCWYLSAVGATCGDTCTAQGLDFSLLVAGEETPLVPMLLGFDPTTRQFPWGRLECYVPGGDRYHTAHDTENASEEATDYSYGGTLDNTRDNGEAEDWSYSSCQLACPCT